MDALLLAAGLGTRLRPLTDDTPKPLIKVAGKPLIEWNLEHLARIGVERVVVNTHYLHEKLEAYLESEKGKWGFEVLVSHEPILLDTGGGLKKALPLLRSEQILIWNSDTVFEPGIFTAQDNLESEFERFWSLSQDSEKKPLVTLLVKSASEELAKRFGALGLRRSGRICKFLGESYGFEGEEDPSCEQVIFTGVSIVHRDIEKFFPSSLDIFSYTRDLFPKVLQSYADIRGMDKDDKKCGGIYAAKFTSYWNDVGTIDRLDNASNQLNCILSLHEQVA